MREDIPLEFDLIFFDVVFLDAQEFQVLVQLLQFVVKVLLLLLVAFLLGSDLLHLHFHHF